MPDVRRKRCKCCRRWSNEVGELSWTGLCEHCGPARQRDHNEQMHNHSGPIFQDWRRRVAASVGAIVLDDVPQEP